MPYIWVRRKYDPKCPRISVKKENDLGLVAGCNIMYYYKNKMR
jgi:hypothetical protein